MGENIRQNPIRERAVLLGIVAVTTLIATRVGLQLVPGMDPAHVNLVAAAMGLGVAATLALTLKLQYPSFRLNPGEIHKLERAEKAPVYRVHLTDGRVRRVLITGGPTRQGTAQQLLNVLPGATLPAHAPTSTIEQHERGRATTWVSLTRPEALRELRAITQGLPAEPSDPVDSGERTVRSTAEYLEQRDRAGASEQPDRELVQQWERDDSYGTHLLEAAGVRMGAFGLLRFLTWAVMLASLVYLSAEEETDGMAVSIALWAAALLIGLVRGVLIDQRARQVRQAVTRLVADHPHLRRRGMPAPWVEAAAWSPAGTAGILRAAAFLLALLFLIGLITVFGEPDAAPTGVIAAIFATFVIVWILLGIRLGRRRVERRRIAEDLAGPRLYWIEHPEQLMLSDDEDGQYVPVDGDSGVA